jgi:NhaC family Na+:H+ antiporter
MKRKIPYVQCLAVIIVMSLSLVINIVFLKKPVYLGIIIGIIAAFVISIKNGYRFLEIVKMMYKGLSENIYIFYIMSMIGMLIGIWKAGGIIPSILYYSFGLINKKIFVLLSFILSSVIGLLMGTSSGTISTIGIILIGLGSTMGFPSRVIAGAVVSGAFLGDRSSPVSAPLNVLSSLTDTKAHENFKYFWSTMSVGIFLALVFYSVVGLVIKGNAAGINMSESYKELIIELFNVSPWLLFPPFILIGLSIFRIPVIHSLLATIIISGVFSALNQGLSLVKIFLSAIYGYNPSISAKYSAVLAGGGLLSLKTMLIVILSATSLNGIFEGTEMITTIVMPLLKKIKTRKDLQLFTVAFSILSAVFVSNQLMSIVIPSGVLKSKYKDMNIDGKILARLLSDSGVMACSLIPWNVAALTPAVFMGVGVLEFAPYAFLGYAMPFIAVINIFLTDKKANTYNVEESI